jgi:hypothetical protein
MIASHRDHGCSAATTTPAKLRSWRGGLQKIPKPIKLLEIESA